MVLWVDIIVLFRTTMAAPMLVSRFTVERVLSVFVASKLVNSRESYSDMVVEV